MMNLSPYDADLITLLRSELHFSKDAIIKQETSLDDKNAIRFDLIIVDGQKTFIFELKRIVRLAELSRLGFTKLLLTANRADVDNFEFVIVGKRGTKEAIEAAERTGLRIIILPADMNIADSREKPGNIPVKLTASKSWQVIAHLLKRNETSIRQLALGSGVSYGWTHATVKSLAEKGIVSDTGGQIKISDVNKLLNGVAWERPFERLFSREIRIAADNPISLAHEICIVSEAEQIPCAFTSYTAGEIYTGYSARHDSVYMYLKTKNIETLLGMFDTAEDGITVRIYTPDRDVFLDRKTFSIPGVCLVSPAQALLDCAGLGYGGRDLTLKLVEVYGGL
jgi:hypothetical protein